MKYTIVFLLLCCAFWGCQSSATDTNHEEPAIESSNSETLFESNQWDEFRMAIVNNDSDFDMLKHYNPEQVSSEVSNTLLEDDYTKTVLAATTYDMLEDAILDDVSCKALYVIAASGDNMLGTIYYFQFTSYGIQLIGTMPY